MLNYFHVKIDITSFYVIHINLIGNSKEETKAYFFVYLILKYTNKKADTTVILLAKIIEGLSFKNP